MKHILAFAAGIVVGFAVIIVYASEMAPHSCDECAAPPEPRQVSGKVTDVQYAEPKGVVR